MQYTQLFGATRLPGPSSDSQTVDNISDYIIVMHNGNAYEMDVKDAKGNDLNASQIYYGLQHILNESKRLDSHGLIGLLTSDSRWKWLRENILEIEVTLTFIFQRKLV